MSEQAGNEPLLEPVRGPGDQAHEQVVRQVRDITRGGAVVFETGGAAIVASSFEYVDLRHFTVWTIFRRSR